MVLKKGDFVRISFTGSIKGSGEVFDTTYEDVAKKNGLYDPKIAFKARPMVIGARHILPGLDKALEGLEVGEKKTVEIQPEDGFGLRDPTKIKLFSLRDFKKRGIDPVPGMRIEVDDEMGRVQSVSGGRVRMDFNHGLAGRVLEYNVKVEEKTNKKEEKIRQLLELYLPVIDSQEFAIKLKEKTVEVLVPDKLKLDPAAALAKLSVTRDTFSYVEGVDEIVYKEVYQKKPPAKTIPKEEKAKPASRAKKPRKKKASSKSS